MKIAVIAGGLSPERDVSLLSGALIANALVAAGYSVALADLYLGIAPAVDIPSLFTDTAVHSYSIPAQAPDLDAIVEQRRRSDASWGNALIGRGILDLCRQADLTYIALHGAIGENGQFQATLDCFGIPYTGSGYSGSLLAMDKDLAKQIMRGHGICTADWCTYRCREATREEIFADAMQKIGCPCVVKPCGCGSSIGVSIAEDAASLRDAIDHAFCYEDTLLIERKMIGREFSVGVLGQEALPPIEILPLSGFYDYRNKYQSGCTKEACPADISPAQDRVMREMALAVHHALRLEGISRTDIILTAEGTPYCLEVNTLPGMTPQSLLPQEAAACGISYQQLCAKIVEMGLQKNNIPKTR